MSEEKNNKDLAIDSDSDTNSDNDDTQILTQTNSTSQSNTKKDKKKKKKNKSKAKNTEISQTSSKPQSAMAKLILERKKLQEEEDARIKALEEEQERKIKEEEEREARLAEKAEEEKKRKRKAKHDKIEKQKQEGTYKTKSEKEKEKKNQEKLEQLKKLGISIENGKTIIKHDNLKKTNSDIETKIKSTECIVNKDLKSTELRSPIFTILGHVDVGKTTLLDNLRQTTVQSHEAGGITQQLGATLLTPEIIFKKIGKLNLNDSELGIPGLLLIDTPGHEIFSNLRQKGVILADIAIVIIDLVHGLEPQTIESVRLLEESCTPFVFALNKIDRLFGFDKYIRDKPIEKIILEQDIGTQSEFDTRFNQIKVQIMELGLNCELVWKNNSPSDTVSIIPISAHTGQGIPDLLLHIIELSKTTLVKKITWVLTLECVGMEITKIEGHGYVLDCVLKQGMLSRGDIIKIQSSTSQNIVTQIKSILTVPTNKDSKYSNHYIQHDSIKASCGIKICANGLDKALVGTFIELGTKEELEAYSNSTDLPNKPIQNIPLDITGIAIHTSSYGSLEALTQFIKADTEIPIPVKISQGNIGNVMKKNIAQLIMTNNQNSVDTPENMFVLAFEVDIDKEAENYAKDNGIIILKDDTVYRLCNQYKECVVKIFEEKKEKLRSETVFPCVLKIIESNLFNKKNPLVMGVEIQEGNLHIGTPLIILPSKTYIGIVVGIQVNKQDVKIGKKGQSVCVKINNEINPNITYGRQFTHTDLLYSNISRKSVDILKEYFKKDVTKDDIGLMVRLKKEIGF